MFDILCELGLWFVSVNWLQRMKDGQLVMRVDAASVLQQGSYLFGQLQWDEGRLSGWDVGLVI